MAIIKYVDEAGLKVIASIFKAGLATKLELSLLKTVNSESLIITDSDTDIAISEGASWEDNNTYRALTESEIEEIFSDDTISDQGNNTPSDSQQGGATDDQGADQGADPGQQ